MVVLSRLKIGAVIAGLTFGLSACADIEADYKNRLAAIERANAANASSGAQTGGVAAVQPEESQRKVAQIIMPNDKRTATAINDALPNIKKVLGIHQCMKTNTDALRQMNFYAVPGTDMAMGKYIWNGFPNNETNMKYHDHNKCVSVSTLDQWTMPALNALQFRAVYFADDSGETVNFVYLFKKVDDGSWKIAEFEKR